MNTTASIKYLWWIETGDFENVDYKNLTWSATLATFNSDLKNVSVLIDYGSFQGWKNDLDANEKLDKEALGSDMMVLTHAHMDHCGRVPFLVKNGYNKPIYATKITALQAQKMLLDYVSIMKDTIEKIQSRNNKFANKFKSYLYIIESYEKIYSPKISKEDTKKLKQALEKKYPNENLQELFKEAKAVCEEYKVYSFEDIQNQLTRVPELLFDDQDVEKTMWLIKYLEFWEEKTLNDSYYIDKYTSNTLSDILEKVKNWFNEDISVDINIFSKIREELDKKISITKNALLENQEIEQRNTKLWNDLEEALWIINLVDKEETPELYSNHIETEEYYNAQELLKEHSIEDIEEIEDCLEKKYHIEYDLNFLNKVKKQLKHRIKTSEDKNKKIIDSIKLRFLEAGHIEWSVQALVTVVTEDIGSILSKKSNLSVSWFKKKTNKHTNFLFSWDLWRIKQPNISWTPENSELKLDYIQMESTYADRVHPDRIKEVNNFFDAIEKAPAKVVIPAFSMQRTQEVLITLIERMLEDKWSSDELIELKEELNKTRDEYNSLIDKTSNEAISLKSAIELIKKDIAEVKKSSFFQRIVLDSPLSKEITSIYINHLGEKYNLLDPNTQIKLFGREVIEYISTKDEQEALYAWKRKNLKEIIVTSSWMCEWWAVVSHLERNLQNSRSTIIFSGYTPPNSRWGKIKAKEPVSIEWNVFDVKCRVVDIKAFSGHIDQEEILEYLNNSSINRWATIALNHWTDVRSVLAEKIQSEVIKTRRSIKTVIPNLGDTVEIKI